MVIRTVKQKSKNFWRDQVPRLFVAVWASLILVFPNAKALAGPDAKVDFNAEVLPILSRTCFPCHGPDDQARQAALRLDTKTDALRTNLPVIRPGEAESSLLFRRITSPESDLRMPPPESKHQLTTDEVDLLRRWINEGAAWGEHWSFLPLKRQTSPVREDSVADKVNQVRSPGRGATSSEAPEFTETRHGDFLVARSAPATQRIAHQNKELRQSAAKDTWPRESIDAFILAQLEQMGLRPSPEAVKETLLRRASLDLIGLPPTLEELSEFVSDDGPDAFERLVDRLLASPHFGERWGRHWLDAARYADSSGFEGDPPRNVWKYRDWVINAMNDDLPFDAFVIKQIAGHLLPNSSEEDRIATGFLLNSQQDGGSEPSRLDAVVDRVNTLGTVFLGLTIGCAQCHSHKFDPISHQEYYELFAFVNSADEFKLEFASPEQLSRRDALAAQLASLTAERTEYVTHVAKLPADKLKSDPGYLERMATIELLQSRIPEFSSALVLKPAAPERMTTLFVRGEYARPGERVVPNVPRVLPPLFGLAPEVSGEANVAGTVSIPSPADCKVVTDSKQLSELETSTKSVDGQQTASRKPTLLDFANWLVSSDQPLTPRVTVNRVWQQLFGRGLVATENDFGTQGTRPTHPELLDSLAFEFSHRGWRTKTLIRRIVGSATYRQSSYRRGDLEATDPENRFLARQSRLRLEAEVIRDTALAVGGLLSTKIGGPSVYPFQHEGIMINRATPAAWKISAGEDRYRRGLYTYYWRLTPHPQLQTFDAPDAITACTRRQPSNTPLQAISLLNEPTFVEPAEALARRLVARRYNRDDEGIETAFENCLARKPVEQEVQLLLDVLRNARQRFNSASRDSIESNECAAWTQLTRTIMNLEEFIVRE